MAKTIPVRDNEGNKLEIPIDEAVSLLSHTTGSTARRIFHKETIITQSIRDALDALTGGSS